MYVLIIILFAINFLAAVGWSDILSLNSDRRLYNWWWLTTIGFSVAFFSMPSIMEKLLIGVFIYEVLGFLLYIRQCLQYNKEQEKERESW
jgi:hypothetical protein